MTSELSSDQKCFIPQELIIEILLRVPVRSLGRFKSVCKTWHSLISTPSFAKSHLELNNPASLLLVLRDKDSVFPLNLNFKDISNLSDSRFEIESYLSPLPLGCLYNIPPILGSSQGLVWINGSSTAIHILNPITKECRNVPFPEPNYHQKFLCELYWAYGFGFVPAIHDFRLVLLPRQHSRPYKLNNRVHIFSLREDKWRELDVPSDVLQFLEASLVHHSLYPHLKAIHEVVLLNDAFYWVAPFATGDMGEFFVLKFDVAKETFSTLSNLKQMAGYPRGNCKYYCRESSIGVNEHDNVCVCQLLFTVGARFVVEMWMLEEQQQRGDWKLIFRIGLEYQFSKKFPRLLGLTLNGNIFIKIGDGQEHQVWLLDPSQYPPTYKIVMKKNAVYVTDFVASLISPHYVC